MTEWRRSLSEYALFLASFCVQHLRYTRKRPPTHPRSILLIKLDHLGDVLLSLPVLMNLREAYPEAHITMLAGSWVCPLLESHPEVDELLSYNAPFFARTASPTSWWHRWRLLRRLTSQRYDLTVDLRGSWLTLAYAALGGSTYRFDRATRNVSWRFHQDAPVHELDRNLATIGAIPAPHRVPFWPVSVDQIQWAWQFLSSEGIALTHPLVALHPGSPMAIKRWPAERFAELVNLLHSRLQAQVLLLGTSDEQEVTNQVTQLASVKVWNLTGRTSLAELTGVLKNCTLFVGNDSGPMHLAAAVGVPTVGLFGPSDAERFGPVGPHVRRLQAKQDCPPCMSNRCRRGLTSCLDQIPVSRVWQAITGLIC